MNFSAWSIRNPVPAVLLFVLLTATGLIAFDRLSVQNFPDRFSQPFRSMPRSRARPPLADIQDAGGNGS